jgi:oligopeptide transport system ATP-binding protein
LSTLLSVRGLKTYFELEEGLVKAVDGVSFDLERGRTLGIVGESGSGKSVTNLSILRLIPSPPGRIVDGQILFDGKDIVAMPDAEIRKLRGKRIAMIFQDPMSSLNPFMRISKQMMEVTELHLGYGADQAYEHAVKMLQLVGISDARTRVNGYPHELSGGMRQRVTIALATVCRPDFIIADEPTTALDVVVQRDVLAMIREIQRELGSSLLFVTHDLAVHANLCDRLGVMYAGRLVEEGPTADLLRAPRHPYTAHLVASLPRIGDTAPKASLPGAPPNLADPPSGCRFHPRCPLAMDICRQEVPPMQTIAAAHRVACFAVQ